MNTFAMKAAVGLVSVLVLGACAGGSEKIHQRLASPDGTMEAVVMMCPMAGDMKVKLLAGAVFDAKGLGCDDMASRAITSFLISSSSEDDPVPAASVEWLGGKAVFDVDGDRTIVNRSARAGAPLDLLVIKGTFDDADIVSEE